jgi:transmembrane sensor
MKNNISHLSEHISHDNEQVLDQALRWLSELDRGLSPQRTNELKQWLSQSDKHKDTFLEMASMWDDLDVLAQLSDIFPYKNTCKKWYQLDGIYQIAASVLFCVMLSVYYVLPYTSNGNNNITNEHNELVTTYLTKIGEKSTVELSDGSIMTLNTNSEVTVKYSKVQRNLILNYGEVHIDVAHNKKRKFLVHAGGKVIEAIGTAFNVQHYNDVDIELMVTEGTVVVSELASSSTSQTSNIIDHFTDMLTGAENTTVEVTAGEQVNLKVNQEVKVSNVKVEESVDEIVTRLSWLEGNLVFKGESLEQAVDEISRYSQWKLELQGDDVKKIKIIGRFQTGDITLLLSILNKNFNINSKYGEDNKIILSLKTIS